MIQITCPVCKSLVERGAVLGEFQPVELDERGLPWACASREGFGLPIWDGFGVALLLDGAPVEHPIAYDRREGVVWVQRFSSPAAARRQFVTMPPLEPSQNYESVSFGRADPEPVIERREGVVTVEWQEPR